MKESELRVIVVVGVCLFVKGLKKCVYMCVGVEEGVGGASITIIILHHLRKNASGRS